MPKLVFRQDMHNKLHPDTTMFPMIFKAGTELHLGQQFNFYKTEELTDTNGLKTWGEEVLICTAQLYTLIPPPIPLQDVPEHMLNWYTGKTRKVAMAEICERLKITPETLVVVTFLTKDLTIDPTTPEL